MTPRPASLALPLLLAPCLAPAQDMAEAPAPTPATAEAAGDAEVIETHGVSTFGDLTYGPDFERLDYVNPDAPKGGEFSMSWSQSTFDSFNPYTVKGNPEILSSSPYESLLTGTADTIGESYCLLCGTIRYPQDKAWVEFDIRPEARFSDGSPVTPEDVLFSYEIFRDQGLPSFRLVLPQTIASAEVVDDTTIRFTFTEDAPMRNRIESPGGLPIVQKAWFEEGGAPPRREPARARHRLGALRARSLRRVTSASSIAATPTTGARRCPSTSVATTTTPSASSTSPTATQPSRRSRPASTPSGSRTAPRAGPRATTSPACATAP